MTTYLSNAFSLQMIKPGAVINTMAVDLPAIVKRLNLVSVVGHSDTARLFSTLLGIDVPVNRQSVSLTDRDVLYVGQITGGRLPEGATTLPAGIEISWICVRLNTVRTPAVPWWTKGGGSIYDNIDTAAENVAAMVNGQVSLKTDRALNPYWEINAPGFYGEFFDD